MKTKLVQNVNMMSERQKNMPKDRLTDRQMDRKTDRKTERLFSLGVKTKVGQNVNRMSSVTSLVKTRAGSLAVRTGSCLSVVLSFNARKCSLFNGHYLHGGTLSEKQILSC